MGEHKRYDFSVNDVSEVYAGPGGKLWELLMGEQIHVGGPEQTDLLAKKAGIDKAGENFTLLDICSALGGPARHLAEKYGINVVGLDITPEMVLEAKKRTKGKPYASKIEYRIGSGLDIPAHLNSFEVVWGQDSWCYIRDKVRLIEETWRVLKSGGTLAFTDWIWGSVSVSEEDSDFLMEFMVFPDLQTLNGYAEIIESVGYKVVEKQDLQEDFAKHMDIYVDILQKAKPDIETGFSAELYANAEEGVIAWQKAAHEKKVGRGLWVAKKP
ncbi:MAG: class I SAM-dependent methyltransferase [Promethearchaeota archaeon]|jgi:SAM-dependent methyltransferase